MEKGAAYKFKLGVFMITGTLLLVLSMYYIGDKQHYFGSNYSISAVFSHVSGLRKGNNVRYSGINIGTVQYIRMINDTSIIVEMVIKEEMMKFIRRDAIATIGTDGLMGDQLININPGNPTSSFANEFDTLNTIDRLDSERMLRGLGQTGNNVEIISSNLVDIMEKINSGEGTVGNLVFNQQLAELLQQTMVNLALLSSRLSSLTITLETKLLNNEGPIGTLLTDTVLSNNIKVIALELKTAGENLNRTTEKLDEVVDDLKEEKGIAGAAISDTNMRLSFEESLENVRLGTAAFNENMEAMRHHFLFKKYFEDQEKEKIKSEKRKK